MIWKPVRTSLIYQNIRLTAGQMLVRTAGTIYASWRVFLLNHSILQAEEVHVKIYRKSPCRQAQMITIPLIPFDELQHEGNNEKMSYEVNLRFCYKSWSRVNRILIQQQNANT